MVGTWLERRPAEELEDHPEHRTLVALDMERYGRPEWTDLTRVQLRRRLNTWFTRSLGGVAVTEDDYHRHSIGDGYLLSIDPHVPRDVVLTALMSGLRGRLVAFNRRRPAAQRLRVRMAIHGGDVLRDPHPIEGRATILTCRLLDADVLRACLGVTEQPLAVIASPLIYDSIVAQRFGRLDPGAWHPVAVPTKDGSEPAWVHVPHDIEAPARTGAA